mmetsp:Transcript_69482/g.122888  ORF Transcript_69482/g.122888 Transcript_69482/m.122888 type:complete len:325 (-) Transcript_69482:45-1019(-)|eukprot:CAMPEP_0197653588 /NCGR_PEP_ID=MMETSP1338-20131121/36250_1 /TAXON_ID=43686 ORGANISM="Pelagodinium beii, Strain RCC1491" /NCGR_SAMPLE_ID=MMETSP1338 /ASSEMBLY_ACC=CAM_ASM_000754 /LENGTH=324 /DNA_ID=CAMNT_0043228761 /DNA_START=72 /DNA_END=1046 /DNA_ORIENTATION=-
MRLLATAAACSLAVLVQAGDSRAFLQKETGPVIKLPVKKEKVVKEESVEKLSQTDVDKQVEAFMDQRYVANLAELSSFASTASTQAAAAAEEAKVAEQRVKQLDTKNQALLANAKEWIGEAESHVKAAGESNKQLKTTLKDSKEFAEKNASAAAEQLATVAVEDMFKSKYKELDDWRKEVLTNHWENARRAGLEAIQPYEYMMGIANQRAKQYEVSSQSLSSVANGLSEQAKKAALAAGLNRMNGNADGAGALDQVAQQLRQHGQDLNVYAKGLHKQSEMLSRDAPTYLDRGVAASKRARYDANPGYLPPRTMNPDFAYVPPAA